MRTARIGKWILFPSPLGWFSLAWLVYLLIPIAILFIAGTSAGLWALQIAGTAAMLALFVLGFQSRDGWRNTLVVAGMALLGVVLSILVTPANWGMLVYAAGFAGIRKGWRPALTGFLAVMACFALLYALDVIGLSFLLAGCLLASSAAIGNFMLAKNIELSYRLREARSEVERLAALAERERIGRDLHDVLGQSLSAIVLKSELARRLAVFNPERAFAEIADVERAAREALTQLRAVVQGYRGDGLPAEIARARSLLAAAGIELETSAGEPALTAGQERTLSLILREAVTNVVRHSGARHCRIELWSDPQTVTLLVADDGRGLAPGIGETGIRGMKERAAKLGGSLDLVANGLGTEVRAEIPALQPEQFTGLE